MSKPKTKEQKDFFKEKKSTDKPSTVADLIVAPLVWLVIFIFALVILFNEIDGAKKLLEAPSSSAQAQEVF